MLILRGAPALSEFSQSKLLSQIQFAVGTVTSCEARFIHFIDLQDNLNDLELEQYNLVLEEQAYPFEEKAIVVHEKNIELLSIGIYNKWIDSSIAKLAVLMPARYARSEQENTFVDSLVPPEQQPKSAGKEQQQKVAETTAMIGE